MGGGVRVLRERYLWLLICGEISKEGGLCPQLTYESESNTAGAVTSCLVLPLLITVTETSLPPPGPDQTGRLRA